VEVRDTATHTRSNWIHRGCVRQPPVLDACQTHNHESGAQGPVPIGPNGTPNSMSFNIVAPVVALNTRTPTVNNCDRAAALRLRKTVSQCAREF
jgi:hypothetical protein